MNTSISKSGFYGSRGRLQGLDSAIRRVAPTFGKALFLTYSSKCTGPMVVESDAERLVAHMLTLDPGVRLFRAQPFTVDLIDRRIHKTVQSLTEARARHRGRCGPKFYTPDFFVEWHLRDRTAIEVKFEGYEGDVDYALRLSMAQDIIEASGIRFLRVVLSASPRHPLKASLPLLTKAALRVDLWPSAELVHSVEATLESGAVTVNDLCKALALTPNLIPILIVSGVLSASLSQQAINGALAVAPAYGDLGHLALLEEMAR